jgi:hypothetical protein
MKNLLFLTAVLALLFAASVNALEPGDTLWTRTYGGSMDDQPYSVQQTTDGGYIIAGYTGSFPSYDVYLVKTDPDGDTLWTQTYGGSNYDKAFSVQQTTDGGYIVAGETWSFGIGRDVYLLKTDADGDTLWSRTYGGNGWDGAYSTQQTTDGGYIISGFFELPVGGDWAIYLVKTAANGDSLWTRTYGQSEMNEGYCVRQTTDGGYMVAGYTGDWGEEDLYLVKTDTHGDTLWTRTYGGRESDWAESVRQTTDGGYIVAGSTNSFGAGDYDFYLLKTDSSGDTLWTRTYGGSDLDVGFSVQQTTDGGYIVAGGTFSFGAGQIDCYLLKTDPNGGTLWTHTYGGSRDEQAYSVRQTADGGYIVAARTNSFGAGAFDVWLLKVAGEAQLPDVSIEMTPDNPPVVVPQGGSFGYTGTVTNNTEDPQITGIWVMAVGPLEGVYGPFKDFYDFPLNPSQSRSAHFNQRVPNLAPPGFYNYIAYCGDYPSTVMDSSSFQVEVIQGQFTEAGEAGWVLTGSFLEGDFADLPSEFALLSNYPNPFNASTVISYELPVSSHVKLEVYNLFGQKVSALVDGQQEAGYQSVTWDPSDVSSGLYFYKLTAGDISETKRMILIK